MSLDINMVSGVSPSCPPVSAPKASPNETKVEYNRKEKGFELTIRNPPESLTVTVDTSSSSSSLEDGGDRHWSGNHDGWNYYDTSRLKKSTKSQ